MAGPVDDVFTKFGAPEAVPNDVLYQLIKQPEVWKSLLEAGDRAKDSVLGKEVVRRAKSDLMFLSRYFLWETNPESVGKDFKENRIMEHVHQRVCDLFVKKDCTKSIAEQDTRKERLILYPRGDLKSTIDACDVVQWILNFPAIRILFLTAADDLATGFVDVVKGHFIVRIGMPSLMNVFFPEYCVDESLLGPAGEFTCPIWAVKKIKRVEPTLMSSSIVSTLSGFHFDVIKADDCVSNKNSLTSEQCKKVTNNFDINSKMLMPYGYLDRIGTRYADEDMYGDMLRALAEVEAANPTSVVRTSGPCWEIIENIVSGLRVLIGRAIVIKPEVRTRLEKEGKAVTYQNAGPAGCDLLFPEHQTFPWLMNEFSKNEKAFEGQLNQNPRPASYTTFDRPLLLKHTIPFTELPIRGPISVTWDFAFSKIKGRDYSTGSAQIWNEKGQGFVIDLIRQRFTPTGLAQAVVAFAVKWRPFVIGIEDASGSRLLEPTVLMEAAKTGIPEVISVCGRIDWFKPDNQKEAKKIRMAALHPLLMNDQLWFAAHLPYLQILYDEFERCLTSHHHDDIPDVLSQQPKYMPRVAKPLGKDQKAEVPYPATRTDAAWNLLFEADCDAFGRPGMGPPPPVVNVLPEPETKAETPDPAFDPILGAGICG